MKLNSINQEQRLYVMAWGSGFTCYGFEILDKKAAAVAAWLGTPGPTSRPGTRRHFDQCNAILKAGGLHSIATGRRCPAELIPELIGLEGARVEVTAKDYRRRFYVGKSTGWLPCHLEVMRRDSHGGGAVYWPDGARVRTVHK